jgi:hypothetical protein
LRDARIAEKKTTNLIGESEKQEHQSVDKNLSEYKFRENNQN